MRSRAPDGHGRWLLVVPMLWLSLVNVTGAWAVQIGQLTQSQLEARVQAIRERLANPSSKERVAARDQLAEITITVALDLERALSDGDLERQEQLEQLIRKRLNDTLDHIGQRAAKGDVDALVAEGVLYARNLFASPTPTAACDAFRNPAQRLPSHA